MKAMLDRLPQYRQIFIVAVVMAFVSTVLLYNVTMKWSGTKHTRGLELECIHRAKAVRNFTKQNFESPVCNNILSNLTSGHWRLRKGTTMEQFELDKLHTEYRKSIGMAARMWRPDGRCGYAEPIPTHRDSSSICNPHSPYPCCTDFKRGVCVSSDSPQCQCDRCFDSSKYVHADLAEWLTEDERCKWINYTAKEACAVLNGALNPVSTKAHGEFHFVGDSLIRNMFMGLLLALTGRPNNGTWKYCLTSEFKEQCSGHNQFIQFSCLATAVADDIDDVDDVCGNLPRNFDVTFKPYFSSHSSEDLNKLIKSLLHKPNTYVTLGIGVLERTIAEVVINHYLRPAVEVIKSANSDWPRLIWVHPLTTGLLSPESYWDGHHGENLPSFIEEVDAYLKPESIPSLNYVKLTQRIHSHDGTHYGLAVNFMKAQIWLNYLASLTHKS